jgi:dTDP-4-amino-4,6-dideoxygalactose transaminase
MAPILAFAARHGCAVVEDACQAHGAEYRGRRAGSMGDFGCFSFYPTKNLGAFGDAGLIVTNDAEKASLLRRLRHYGQVDRYSHQDRGYNCRLDELQAAILRAKLPHLDRWTERRRRIARAYSEGFAPDVVVAAAVGPAATHVYHLYVVRVKARDAFRAHLEREGIQTLIHYPVPVHHQAAYAEFKTVHLPVTESSAQEIVSIPIYPELEDREVEMVIRAVNRARHP